MRTPEEIAEEMRDCIEEPVFHSKEAVALLTAWRDECVEEALRTRTMVLETIERDRLRAENEALRNTIDDFVMAFDLPGDHCEMEQAIERARIILHAKG